MGIETDGYFYPKPAPRPKKQPKPLKRTPLNKARKPILQTSAKQRAKLAEYEQAKRENYSQQKPCFCCGRMDRGVTCSHLVGRSHSFELVSEALNFIPQCHECHRLTEQGRYFQLQNGLKLMERLTGLGGAGLMRLRYILNQFDENTELWAHSALFETVNLNQ